ncbi:MAG: hypothetical protein LBG47_10625 [Prevotellaceae bacterium]|jgi:hypothetical protein|nr:hypothetical protein [Prevotellaceae bacterium]
MSNTSTTPAPAINADEVVELIRKAYKALNDAGLNHLNATDRAGSSFMLNGTFSATLEAAARHKIATALSSANGK